MDFVFYLAVDWDDFFRRHLIREIAARVRRRGTVLCVQRPICPVASTLKHRAKLARWLRQIGTRQGHLERKAPNLYVYEPFVLLHDRLAPSVPGCVRANRFALTTQLVRVLERLRLKSDRLITWLFKPSQVDYLNLVGETFTVYECYDDYLAPENHRTQAQRQVAQRQQERILGSVDVTLATSEGVAARLAQRHRSVHFVPNAADVQHFSRACDPITSVPSDIADLPRPVLGFVGTLNQGIDLDLLVQVAARRPAWSVVLVGPFYACDEGFTRSLAVRGARQRRNIHFLGKRAYERIPSYLKGFDVCLIPYANSVFNWHRSPVKLYEYLATGKPIVSTDIPAVRSFRGLVRVARDAREFEQQVAAALAEQDEALRQQRLAAARENSWEKRAEQVLGIIEAALEERRA